MNIEYYTKKAYGREDKYIAEDSIAVNIAMLTGRRTIHPKDIKALQNLGFTLTEVPNPNK